MKLSQRLREATEPTRELDLAFHKLLGKAPAAAKLDYGAGCPPTHIIYRHKFDNDTRRPLPHYTSGGIPAELLAAVPPDYVETVRTTFDGRKKATLNHKKTGISRIAMNENSRALALAAAIAEVLEDG